MSKEDMGELLKKHRLVFAGRILLAIVAVAALAVFIYFQYTNRQYTEMAMGPVLVRQSVSGTTDIAIGDNLITYSCDGASCMNSSGDAIWNQTFEMQNPMEAHCGNVVAFADYDGRDVYVMDTDKILGQLSTNMPIRKLDVTSNGVIMTIQEDSKVTWIYLYDTTGKTLAYFSTRMSNTGYPTAVSVSPKAKLVGIGYTYPESGELKTRVAFYNFGDVGENEIDHLVSVYNYSDTFVPFIKFMNDSTAFAVADNRFMIYSGSEVPEIKKELLLDRQVLSVYNNESYIGLIFYNDDTEHPFRLEVYNTSGDMVTEIPLAFTGVTDVKVVFDEGSIIACSESMCYVYNMSGRIKYEGSFDNGVRIISPRNGNYKYMIVTNDSIYTAGLN
jgi:hypothetical protein